jgi:chromosome segregation ATPase
MPEFNKKGWPCFMVKEFITSAIKKVTLDLIYQVVDERTEKILDNVEEVKKQQKEDFRYLVQKIDTDTASIRNEFGQFKGEVKDEFTQIRNEFGQLRNEFGQLRSDFGQLRNEVGQLNQRIDTVIQMLVNIKQQG